MATEAKHNGIAKLIRGKKSRWLFPRKKSSVVSTDQTDGSTIHRSSSNSSLESNQDNLSEEGEQEFYTDSEQDM